MTNPVKPRWSILYLFNRNSRLSGLEHRWLFLVLGLLGVGYILLTLNGYGNHDDIYRMISTWRILLSEQRYEPSRFQGYLVPEMMVGLASHLGDFYLSNLVTTILAIASLGIFYWLLIRLVSPLLAALAVAAIGTNPYWIIAATTSTDYIYPTFFFLLGLLLLLNQRWRVAGIVFALAVSSRLTYGPMVAIAFGFYLPYLQKYSKLSNQFFQGILAFIFACMALYLPVFVTSGMSFSFLNYADDAAGGKLADIARFVYKNIYFWGLPTFLVLTIFFIRERRFYWKQTRQTPLQKVTPSRLVFHAVLWTLIYNQLLFFKLPHQYQYLIPVLFCIAFLVAQLPDLRKQVLCLSLVTALHLVHGVVNFDVLETYQLPGNNNTIHSDGAVVKPGIREGILLRDYRWRSRYQRRLTDDFNQRWQQFGRPLTNPR